MKVELRGLFKMRIMSRSSSSSHSSVSSVTFYGRKRFGPKEKAEINNKTYPIVVEMSKIEEAESRWYTERKAEYPSVTSILKLTMPTDSSLRLSKWIRKKEHELGVKGALQLRDDIRQRGLTIHKYLSDHFLGRLRDEDIPRNLLGYWKSFKPVLNGISEPKAVETAVVHRKLHYAGTFDCVAKYRDHLCLIDWKTSDKPRRTLRDCYDFPIQAVAYAGAVNVDKSYPFKVDRALVVVGYQNGSLADVHLMSRMQCEGYWEKWLERLNSYRNIKFEEKFDDSTL
ncbi:mitochondrial genome maintenance exonuclease 1-like [Corticium candelabrum]|uniref:mitochondrial genome maintenance exonuclease 1-like n=1 Tax=Corticium candelabrum TaxID=121492 RepID=UPI002E2694C0|nr:mitochondrial genome maintenance exonuclease 1-like [Corticium candelabrum]